MKKAIFKSDGSYPHGSLREQPEVPQPEFDTSKMWSGIDKVQEYLKMKDSGRTIPCSENNWKDGQELTYGIDYYLTELRWEGGFKEFAAPIVRRETEDDLWEELAQVYQDWIDNDFDERAADDVAGQQLKPKFIINRRQ